MAASFIVSKSILNPTLYLDFSEQIEIWSDIMLKLMESDLKIYKNNSYFKKLIRYFIEHAPMAKYLYLLCDVLNKKVSKQCKIVNFKYFKTLRFNLLQYIFDFFRKNTFFLVLT